MKKILFVLSVAAAMLLSTSCDDIFQEGQDSSLKPRDPNTLIFKLKGDAPETRSDGAPETRSDGAPATRSQSIPDPRSEGSLEPRPLSAPDPRSEAIPDPRSTSSRTVSAMGATIPVGPVEGYEFYLEETVTTLGAFCDTPETKGTPVYTENFVEMSGGSFYGLAFPASGSALSPVPAIPDGPFKNDGEVWKRKFASDPFGDNDVLYFFLRSPETVAGMGEPQYSLADGKAVVEFDYTVPLNAEDQQDILFTGRPVTKSESEEKIPILFHHALTGVKFATANDNSGGARTYITKVEFPDALYRSARIKIVPSWENGRWVDDPEMHSSSQMTVNYVSGGVQLKSDEVFTLLLQDSDIVDFEEGGSFANKGKYADSFAAAGNENNLNDADASKTFWFIPQQMNDDIVMDVTFHVVSGGKDSGPVTRRIELGKVLTDNVFWRAGEIRTYTLKADLMDVDIEDKVSGFEKTDVVITNTGNIDSFIRAHIVANWYGYAGSDYGVAVGYRSATGDEFVPAWQINATMTGDNYGGVFTGLPGTDWIYNADDGFFYYRNVVPAGQSIPDALFIKYALDTSPADVPPAVHYLDPKAGRQPYTDMELVMEIPVQAIEAREGRTYRQAWEALGVSFN